MFEVHGETGEIKPRKNSNWINVEDEIRERTAFCFRRKNHSEILHVVWGTWNNHVDVVVIYMTEGTEAIIRKRSFEIDDDSACEELLEKTVNEIVKELVKWFH